MHSQKLINWASAFTFVGAVDLVAGGAGRGVVLARVGRGGAGRGAFGACTMGVLPGAGMSVGALPEKFGPGPGGVVVVDPGGVGAVVDGGVVGVVFGGSEHT